MKKVVGKIRALPRSIRYFLRLPSRALKIISTEGWTGFRTKFKNWSHRLASGQLGHEIAVQQSGRSHAHRTVYSAKKADYFPKIKEILENGYLPAYLDGKDSVEVVVPIYNAYDEFLTCLYSLLKYQDIYRIIF